MEFRIKNKKDNISEYSKILIEQVLQLNLKKPINLEDRRQLEDRHRVYIFKYIIVKYLILILSRVYTIPKIYVNTDD